MLNRFDRPKAKPQQVGIVLEYRDTYGGFIFQNPRGLLELMVFSDRQNQRHFTLNREGRILEIDRRPIPPLSSQHRWKEAEMASQFLLQCATGPVKPMTIEGRQALVDELAKLFKVPNVEATWHQYKNTPSV